MVNSNLHCPILDKETHLGPYCFCKLMENLRLRKMAKILKLNTLKIYDYVLGSSFHSTQISKNHSLQGKDQRNTRMLYEVCIFMKPSYLEQSLL